MKRDVASSGDDSPGAGLDPAPFEALLSLGSRAESATVIRTAIAALVPTLGERASCVLLSPRARVVAATQAAAPFDLPIDLERYPEIVAAAESGEAVLIDDVWRDSRLANVRDLLPPSLRSIAVIPLLADDRCAGVLLAQSTSPRRFQSDAVGIALLVGRLAARLLDFAAARPPESAPTVVEDAAPAGGVPVMLAGEGAQTMRIGPQKIAPPGATRPRTILVVDDDAAHATLVQALLGYKGYVVELASDGASAVDRARALRPDLVLMDVCMPGLDGFSAAEQLKEDPATRDIPIVFLSGSDDLMARVRGLRLGAADFLPKPFFAPELEARVERALEQVETSQLLRGHAYTDALTGLGNLRFLGERLAVERSRSARFSHPLALLVLDLDGLKRINDRHGHAAGSTALREVGRVLREETRDTDVAARYGGDEFVVVLPHATTGDAMRFARRILARLEGATVDGSPISVSIGVASFPRATDLTVEEMIERADAAAYQAKRQGGSQARAAAEIADQAAAGS